MGRWGCHSLDSGGLLIGLCKGGASIDGKDSVCGLSSRWRRIRRREPPEVRANGCSEFDDGDKH